MIDPAKILANPVLSIILRAVLGGYVVYMSRKFYADPLGYFRKSSRAVPDFPWVRSMIRTLQISMPRRLYRHASCRMRARRA